jgi:2-oxoglutarate dehydrogenase E1 component
MKEIIKKYKKANDLVWAQEEPRNMGAWSHLMMHFSEAQKFRVASRRYYASPAAGSAVRSKLRHQQVIDYVFDKSKDNMTRPAAKTEAKQ